MKLSKTLRFSYWKWIWPWCKYTEHFNHFLSFFPRTERNCQIHVDFNSSYVPIQLQTQCFQLNLYRRIRFCLEWEMSNTHCITTYYTISLFPLVVWNGWGKKRMYLFSFQLHPPDVFVGAIWNLLCGTLVLWTADWSCVLHEPDYKLLGIIRHRDHTHLRSPTHQVMVP